MSDLHCIYITEPDTFRGIEVIARRRRWPRSEKARIVAESYPPGASATAVAVRHGLHRNQIFVCRCQLRNRAVRVRRSLSRSCWRADRVKILAWDGTGLCLFHKRLENGRFVWPPVQNGAIRLSAAQLRLLLEGLDWSRVRPRPVIAPLLAG
jgi:transposase